MMDKWKQTVMIGCGLVVLAMAGVGCAEPKEMPDRALRMPRGYIYYLDGAGGGTAIKNWSEGVKEGLLAAGYEGAGEMFSWETGLGMIVDQDASVKYKRRKADALAKQIEAYHAQYPEAPIDMLGFSAGAAEVIFAMEALPEDCKINNVVLLGASIGTDYDLTKALKRLNGHLYLYTSKRDMMLGFLMPMTGTADRIYDEAAAGAAGFTLPPKADAETRKLYADKVVTIAWTKQLERDGDYGHHFDNVKMEFVRDHVAPLLMEAHPTLPSTEPKVEAAEPAAGR